MKHSFLYLLAGLFLFACTDDAEQAEVPTAGEPVSMSIHLGVALMQVADPSAETRAAGDKLSDEQKIHKAWLLQFNGTAGTSTLAAVPQLLTMDTAGNTDVSLKAGTGTHRIYIVANVDESIIGALNTSTTLTAFETKVFPCSVMVYTTMATQGLPMSAYKDINMSTGLSNQNFDLKSRMAKVTFRYTSVSSLGTVTLTLRNAPGGFICKPDVASNATTSQRPAGVACEGTLDITIDPGSLATCYVPENLAGGIAGITKETDRSDEKATGKNATYITLESGKEDANIFTISTYSIYLGTDLTANVGDLNIKGNYYYNVSIDVKGNNTLTDKRVKVSTYNNLSVAADGTPATANCYVVTAAGNYYIDATKQGNNQKTLSHSNSGIAGDANYPGINPRTMDPVSANVLWETVNTKTVPAVGAIASNAKIDKGTGKLLFSAGATKGNALIAARDASGTILWSWHIWRIEAQPQGIVMPEMTDNKGFSVTNLRFMDRGLGALRAAIGNTMQSAEDGGLVYQWGRKDPFPGKVYGEGGDDFFPGVKFATTLASSDFAESGSVTPEVAVKNPTTFYTGTDWTTPKNDNLWGAPLTGTAVINNGGGDYTYNTNAGEKSIYDPCPIGWKVMPAYIFVYKKIFGTGVSHCILHEFLSGYYIAQLRPLVGSTGDIVAGDVNGGIHSRHWTSSCAIELLHPSPPLGGMFPALTMFPTALDRAYACGVRCVKE